MISSSWQWAASYTAQSFNPIIDNRRLPVTGLAIKSHVTIQGCPNITLRTQTLLQYTDNQI